MLMYSKKVMEYFQHPKNIGEMKNPDGVGKIGNPVCGDIMWLYIKVAKNKKGKDYIKDIKVKTFGCVAAIATSSAITDIVMGMELDKAEKVSNKDIVKIVQGLPKEKIHCSLLAADALKRAIDDYRKKSGNDSAKTKIRPKRIKT
jgi:nitrogen fixation protein NifU and related proteins